MIKNLTPQGQLLRATLPEVTRRLHRTLLDGLFTTGIVPSLDALPRHVDVEPAALRTQLQELVAGDYVAIAATGEITGVYPLSAVPTPHIVVLDGRRRYAMCAVDALGTAAMLGQALVVESECGECRARIRLGIRPGALVQVEPQETMVVARETLDGPASERCCPFIVFACGPAHAQTLVARVPDIRSLSLDDALAIGELLFGDLRSEEIPAARPRPNAVSLRSVS